MKYDNMLFSFYIEICTYLFHLRKNSNTYKISGRPFFETKRQWHSVDICRFEFNIWCNQDRNFHGTSYLWISFSLIMSRKCDVIMHIAVRNNVCVCVRHMCYSMYMYIQVYTGIGYCSFCVILHCSLNKSFIFVTTCNDYCIILEMLCIR